MTDNWLDKEVSITYREIFELCNYCAMESRNDSEKEVEEISFSMIMDIYKNVENSFPYKLN